MSTFSKHLNVSGCATCQMAWSPQNDPDNPGTWYMVAQLSLEELIRGFTGSKKMLGKWAHLQPAQTMLLKQHQQICFSSRQPLVIMSMLPHATTLQSHEQQTGGTLVMLCLLAAMPVQGWAAPANRIAMSHWQEMPGNKLIVADAVGHTEVLACEHLFLLDHGPGKAICQTKQYGEGWPSQPF